jgi:hypothetical protein
MFVYPSRRRLYYNRYVSGNVNKVYDMENVLSIEQMNQKGNEAIQKGFTINTGPVISKDLERQIEKQVEQTQPQQLLATFLPVARSKSEGTTQQIPLQQMQQAQEPKEGQGQQTSEELTKERDIKNKVMLNETSRILNKLKKESNKKPPKSDEKKGKGLIKI